MQLGEEYMVHTESTISPKDGPKRRICGTVVYVHPNGQYATLEFQGVHGKFRESYYPEQLTEKNRVRRKRR